MHTEKNEGIGHKTAIEACTKWNWHGVPKAKHGYVSYKGRMKPLEMEPHGFCSQNKHKRRLEKHAIHMGCSGRWSHKAYASSDLTRKNGWFQHLPMISESIPYIYIYTGWWFGTFFLFSHILGRINPNWLSYFSEGLVYHQPVHIYIYISLDWFKGTILQESTLLVSWFPIFQKKESMEYFQSTARTWRSPHVTWHALWGHRVLMV